MRGPPDFDLWIDRMLMTAVLLVSGPGTRAILFLCLQLRPLPLLPLHHLALPSPCPDLCACPAIFRERKGDKGKKESSSYYVTTVHHSTFFSFRRRSIISTHRFHLYHLPDHGLDVDLCLLLLLLPLQHPRR